MDGEPKTRRAFSAEFKMEAVRRMAERRAAEVSLKQIGRELDVRDDLLRKWQRQATERAGAPPAMCSPGRAGCRAGMASGSV